MSDLLQTGLAYLHTVRTSKMSSAAVYVRLSDESETDITATVSQVRYERPDPSGLMVDVRMVDFIFATSALAFDPTEGDKIEFGGREYEVTPLAGDPCWRYTDASHDAIRVHTRDIGVIA